MKYPIQDQNKFMKKIYLLLLLPLVLLLLGASGCDETTEMKNVKYVPIQSIPTTNVVEKLKERFVVTSQGSFNAGYDNTLREVLLVKDTFTGEEYLAITDTSLIKLVNAKKEAKAETVNSIVEGLADAFIE